MRDIGIRLSIFAIIWTIRNEKVLICIEDYIYRVDIILKFTPMLNKNTGTVAYIATQQN